MQQQSEYAKAYHAKALERQKIREAKQSAKKILLVKKTGTGTQAFHFEEEIWRNPNSKRQIEVVAELKRKGWKEHDGGDLTYQGYNRAVTIIAPKNQKQATTASPTAAATS